ncbi:MULTISPECIES: homoserine dehydrogenase [Halorussus]|uniref:homoserine dehydrogenase n=1 Tax=Halorussus TaxID=1070314 RepID=UPI000E21755A|nr:MULTISPECIES: homoserine dehydrogenase [Halorussus]NHN60204.1 homoserine dehydrogenase [Halorussus sp. JP-T4]
MRLAVFGMGAVGRSVVELAGERGHTITAVADSTSAAIDPDGIDTKAVLDKKESEGSVGTANPDDALTASYDVLIEATPTTLGDAEPGFTHTRTALERGRHVVLANKGPVAERYGDLRALERESTGNVLFEATVGGAIPVLSTINNLGPENINAVQGVLNGTTNFILSRMAAEGLGYEHVLAEAQDLGVAKADPTFEVSGNDTALKLVIIANVLAQGERQFSRNDVEVEGIEDIPSSVLGLAREDGNTVRLIGEFTGDSIRIGPRLVPESSALAVPGTRNIVQLETEHAGSLNISGRGTGGSETATAIFTDINRLD